MMKVLLVSVNRLKFPHPVFPLGLEYVAEAVAPHKVRILDLCATPDGAEEQTISQAVAEFAPGAVGISIRNIDNTDGAHIMDFLAGARTVVQAVRKVTAVPVILGGAGYTLFPAELLEELGADYGVVGEGERLKGLLDALEKGGNTQAVPGIALRGGPASRATPWRGPVCRSSSSLNPLLGWYIQHGGMLSMQTQRGCPFRCIYCTYPFVEGRRLRPIDPDEVGRTARVLEDAGAKFLCITDSSFNANADHSLAVADAFRKAGVTIPWGGFFMPMAPPDGFYQRLAEAGCTHVEFGTDSLCDTMLDRIQKPFRFAEALQAHRSAQDAGLFVAHFMLLGGPGESSETVDETLVNCEQLEGAVLFLFCGMRIYPNTDLWEHAVREGQIDREQNLLKPVYYTPSQIGLQEIIKRVEQQVRGRRNWIVGGGNDRAAQLMWRMYKRGSTGPLWEKLR